MSHPLVDTCTTSVEQYRMLRRLAEQEGTTPERLAQRFVAEGMRQMQGIGDWSPYTHHDPLNQKPYVEPWPGEAWREWRQG
jgi:hypothetical protein